MNGKKLKHYHDPKKIMVKEFDTQYTDELYVEYKKDGLFHVGQFYDKEPAETIYCKHCGGNEFHVGCGNYFTAIKCKNCEYEISIHEG